MSTNLPSRAQIEQAGDLDFDAPRNPKPAKQELRIVVRCQLNGFPIELGCSGTVEQLPAITKRLRELGAEAPPVPRAGNWGQKPKVELTEPSYNGNGDACCPVHGRVLVTREWEGRKFRSCSAKARENERANARGYCGLRFAD